MAVEFHDYSIKVKEAMNGKINAVLEECAGELESEVKRNTRVDTGKTKNSWRHKVNERKHEAVIGSTDQNAIWEEFGTGEYALNHDGRKGGWWYATDKPGFFGKMFGKKPSNFVFTYGKKPSRAFWNAFTSLKNGIIKRIQDAMKEL